MARDPAGATPPSSPLNVPIDTVGTPAPAPGEGALWAAAHAGDAGGVARLLAGGANPNERGETARETLSALHWASWKGNSEIVGALLGHGADHRSVNKWGKTPLHWAAWMGHSDVAAVLMGHGADAAVLDDDGWSPLHLASRFNHADTVVVLLGSGADPNVPDKLGQTARELAVQLNYSVVVAAIDAHGSMHDRSEARVRASPARAAGLAERLFPMASSTDGPRSTRSRDHDGESSALTGRRAGSRWAPAEPHATRTAHDSLLEQRYQAQEMLDRARMETEAAVTAAQRAADERVRAAEQRSSQALGEALAEKGHQQETIDKLRQELLATEAEVAAAKANHSSMLLGRQNAQDAMQRARAQMDATVRSIQSAANDRVVEAERRTSMLRDEYHADTSRLQATVDQLRQAALEAQTEAANCKGAHEATQAEWQHAASAHAIPTTT